MICASCNCSIELVADFDGDTPCPSCGARAALEGRYRLLSILGQGGQATTYRAQRIADGEIFAVKEVMVRRLDSAKAFTLFEREAAVLRTLRHHGIPRYVEDFTAGEGRSVGLYLVQEFVAGRTLAQLLESHRFTETEVRSILIEMLDILQYLHRFSPPVIHRDVKPSNIIRRDGDDRLALIDFGAVRDVMRDREGGGSTVAGTFGFMAPEQFTGQALPASDIYGLGATAVALLSRQDPARLLDHTRKLAWREAINVSLHTRHILERMLAPDPKVRATDAGALLRELLNPGAVPPPQQQQNLLPSVAAAIAPLSNALMPARPPAVATLAGSRIMAPAPRPASETMVSVGAAPRDFPLSVRNRYIVPRSRWAYAGGATGLAMATSVLGQAASTPGGELVMPSFIGVMLIFWGLFALVSNVRHSRNLRRVLRDGEQTIGRVVSCSRRSRGYRVTFAYEVDGKTYRAQTTHFDGRTLPPGSVVTVLYLRDDPTIAHALVPEARVPYPPAPMLRR